MNAVLHGLAWLGIITAGAYAAGVLLKGISDMEAHRQRLAAKRHKLEFLREQRLREEVRGLVSHWNKGVDWND